MCYHRSLEDVTSFVSFQLMVVEDLGGPLGTDAGPEYVEFAHGKKTCADSSRRNPAGRVSRSAQIDPYAVAAALHVPRTRIERIAREEKPVTADTALRLGKFFKTGAAFWMNIQARYDLETAEDVLAPQIRKITAYEAA